MDVNTSRADLLPEMLAPVLAGGPHRRTARARARSGACAAAMPAGLRAARSRAALPDRAALELTARLELRGIDWADDAAPSPTRPTTRATSASTCAAASATGSSTRPRPSALLRRDRRRAARPSATPTARPRSTAVDPRRRALPGRAARTGCPTSSCAGPSARRRRSPSCAPTRFGDVLRRGAGSGPLGQPHAGRRLGGRGARAPPRTPSRRRAAAARRRRGDGLRGHRRRRRRACRASRCCAR